MLDFLLHSDRHLLEFVTAYGPWVYAILFAIVFAETGIVVTPFLPGDSLLFATGALCATGALETPVAFALLAVAVLWMGVYPKPFTRTMDASVTELLRHVAVPKLN